MEKEKDAVATFDRGRVHGEVLEKETDGRVWFNVKITRPYSDGEGNKEAFTFSRDDLPHVMKVCDLAYDWIWTQKARPKPSGSEL